ncbi:MAG: DmsC/YnfH family molybdoenzyme membrane anchor subunit [Anaerolineales bacterium]
MVIREWALITFTILAQMSVGAFVVLGVAHFFAVRAAGVAEADRLSDRALVAIGPVLVLGLLASLLHLGNPLNAYRAVSNLQTSWLSREIFSSVAFTVVGGLFALMQWRKISTFGVRTVVAGLAALIGLFLVFSMSQVYLLPSQPAWNNLGTPISFFSTTLLLGTLVIGAAFVANYAYVQRTSPDCADAQCRLLRGTLRWVALAAVVLLGAELVTAPMQLAYLAGSQSAAANATAQLMFGSFGLIFGLRLVLVFLGAGVLSVFLYQNAMSPGREKIMGTVAYGALALVLVSEVLGRYIFYASHVKIGL